MTIHHYINAKNYYDLLRVGKGATAEKIEAGFKNLIGYSESFKGKDFRSRIHRESIEFVANEAFMTLMDPEKRTLYDKGKLQPSIEYAAQYLLTPELRDERLIGLKMSEEERAALWKLDPPTYIRWVGLNPEKASQLPDNLCEETGDSLPTPYQILLLRESVEAWNAWRALHPEIKPMLRQGVFAGKDLRGANLRDADISFCNCEGAQLGGADLTNATAKLGCFGKANLDGTVVDNTIFTDADFTDIEASGVRFDGDHPPTMKNVRVNEATQLSEALQSIYASGNKTSRDRH